MMKRTALALALVALAAPAFAGTGNLAPSGPHYNLNLIGVSKAKRPKMLNNGHRIFVALGRNDQTATSKIYLTQGDFEVCDANYDDPAYDCTGAQVASRGAVFQLPCNTNISAGPGEDLVPCDGGESAAYEVWARALGAPNGSATITTCAWDPDIAAEICSSENVVLVKQPRTKPTFTNVTKELTSLVANIDADPANERVALFADNLQDWFWKYENRGLKLAQLRFYLLD